MPRVVTSIALLCAAAFGVAGCSNSPLFDRDSYSEIFSKKVDWFKTPDWARGSHANVNLGPTGPVAPEDLVAADGRCAPKAEPATPAATQSPPSTQPAATSKTAASTDRRVGSVAGDLASAPMQSNGPATLPDRLEPSAPSTGPALASGIALGMSECDVVRRAGQPSNVSIGAGATGERKVVLSYLGGNWPGIYEFQSGRLKSIDAVPVPEKSVQAKSKVRSKKKRAPAKTAHEGMRVYVQ